MTDAARRRAVIVLPTPFGPSRLMAASSGISTSRSLSTTRRRYSAIPLRYLWQEFYATFGRFDHATSGTSVPTAWRANDSVEIRAAAPMPTRRLLAVGGVLRPPCRGVLPVLLTAVRRDIQDLVHENESVHSAGGGVVGPVDIVAVAHEHAEHEATPGATVLGERGASR